MAATKAPATARRYPGETAYPTKKRRGARRNQRCCRNGLKTASLPLSGKTVAPSIVYLCTLVNITSALYPNNVLSSHPFNLWSFWIGD
jgi:hypothetical protein